MMKETRLFSVMFLLSIFALSTVHANPLTEKGEQAQSGLTINRDGFGIPTIQGGDLSDIARAIGRVQAEDRLWQIFFITQLANGRASQYFGPDFIDSDIFQYQINYTDTEVQQQIDTYFTDRTKSVYTSFVQGLNDRIAEVNADNSILPYELKVVGFKHANPVPEFTLYDIIRANQLIVQSFSPSSIPSFQLDNLSDLSTLIDNFGINDALNIFNDIDPTTQQVKSQFTIVPNTNCSSASVEESSSLENKIDQDQEHYLASFRVLKDDAKGLGKKLKEIKALRAKSGLPTIGSNGQVINKQRSASGNPLIRIAPQPNFNQPSDFYQVRIGQNQVGLIANFFTIPTVPISENGLFNQYGAGLQVGQLFANDFLFESINNIDPSQTRTVTIKVAGQNNVTFNVYRSTSGGWVIQRPIDSDPNTMITLRSVFIGKQLRALNALVEAAFASSIDDFKNSFLNPNFQSDILLLEGEYVDSVGNIMAFHTGGWTQLLSKYDRRFAQGISINPAPSNSVYTYDNIAQSPLMDINNSQGFYVGWNSVFKQGSLGSEDTVGGIGISRIYWLNTVLLNLAKISFDDLKQLNLRQYLANSNIPFDDTELDQDADLFSPLFKQRFFQAVMNNPTPDRLQAVNFLQNYTGNWFDGDLNHILNGSDVSDQFILASVWLNAVANQILNPYLAGTSREIATSTSSDPLPTFNVEGSYNALIAQGNTLSRILKLACDKRVFFKGWLSDSKAVDQVIVNALDFAINQVLGGFGAQPWGQGKRPIYQFNNLVLGPVASMNVCNVSGFYLLAELGSNGPMRVETVLALGESGEILGSSNQNLRFNPHCFDQQPFFSQLELIPNPPLSQ